MTGKRLGLLAAAGLAAAVSLSAGDALADECGKSDRVSFPACVDHWFEGSTPYKTAYAKNNCEGQIVVKIDVGSGGRDDLWTLNYGQWKRETYGKKLNDMKCCSRMGDGCSQRKLTFTSCRDNYRRSSARNSCVAENFSQSGDYCLITALCDQGIQSRGQQVMRHTAINARIISVGDISNCSGYLRVGGC